MIALPPFGGVVRNQIGDPRIAFPPALVRAGKAVDDGCQTGWMGLVGNVVDLVCRLLLEKKKRRRFESDRPLCCCLRGPRWLASRPRRPHIYESGTLGPQ